MHERFETGGIRDGTRDGIGDGIGDGIVAGVLSGTSGDGIDVGLTRFRLDSAGGLAGPELLAFQTRPFPPGLDARVREVLDGGCADLRSAALLSRDLGQAFGRAARELADAQRLELDLVGSHGLTVYHHDGLEASGAATLQLGDGDFVAESAGCAVVSDFRQRDVAAGGEGAPLSALADAAIFARLTRPLAILNLGGMANLTLLSEPPERGLAFDTGPAGSLLDGLARRRLGMPFDRDGRAACAGRAQADFVERLLEHPFFVQPPPKSTGRDTFGEAWVESVVAAAIELGLSTEDLLASAVELVARSVAAGLHELPKVSASGTAAVQPERLLVAGGGVHNAALMSALARACSPATVESTLAVGIDPDAREALVFAVLAARCALGIPSTAAWATGAEQGRVLGKISQSP